jgi:hypothetical protein
MTVTKVRRGTIIPSMITVSHHGTDIPMCASHWESLQRDRDSLPKGTIARRELDHYKVEPARTTPYHCVPCRDGISI